MDTKEYLQKALVTEPTAEDYKAVKSRVSTDQMIRLLHGSIGMATESGEILDQIKKHAFYGKELDIINLIEECGDMLWYISIVLDACESSFGESMSKNIAKLKARYGEKFSNESAINRDLDTERNILEK